MLLIGLCPEQTGVFPAIAKHLRLRKVQRDDGDVSKSNEPSVSVAKVRRPRRSRRLRRCAGRWCRVKRTARLQ
jgi:hypothetical protein